MLKLAAFLLLIPLLGGCIRHKVIITSEPSEAMVTWNETYRGRTPIEIPFTWHWWYTLDLEREGYEPIKDKVRLRTRPWFIFPLDFIAEAMPFTFRDTRKYHYQLQPSVATAADTLPTPEPLGPVGPGMVVE